MDQWSCSGTLRAPGELKCFCVCDQTPLLCQQTLELLETIPRELCRKQVEQGMGSHLQAELFVDKWTLNLPKTGAFTGKEDPNIEGLKPKYFLFAFGFLWVLELKLGTVGKFWLFLGCLKSVMCTKIPDPLSQ